MADTINIIVDGNYLLHSEVSIYSGWSKTAFKTEKDEREFLQGVANKFFYVINQLPKGGNVIFCIDSRSWRKAVEIEGGGYKSSREENEDGSKGAMDKETLMKFFKMMDEFSKLLSKVGIIVSRVGGAEGDDLIYLWSKKFTEMGQCSIIISGDRDLTQLVRIDASSWIIQWNTNSKHNRMFIPEGWRESWLHNDDEVSIFNFSIGTDKQDLLKLIRDGQITVETVHPQEVVMNKILSGDDGDDVPPVWIANIKNKKGEPMTVRMTGKKPAAVLEQVTARYGLLPKESMKLWGDDEYMDNIAGLVLRLTKDVDGTAERQKVVSNMKRNAQLVWLDESQLPFNLLAAVNSHITESLDHNETKRHLWNRNGIFAGTKYDETVAPKKFDPFLGMTTPE